MNSSRSELFLGVSLRDPALSARLRSVPAATLAAEIAALPDDFALGLRREDGTTLLAVDRFSIRSMCYVIEDGQLRFAERADQLAGANPDLDPQALYDYLYFHVIPSPRTVYRGVCRLPAGHLALWDGKKLVVSAYWTPRFEPARSSAADFGQLKKEFRERLSVAVRGRVVGKASCFLSGGTDSSTVAGLLREATGTSPATYSIGFDAQGYDEMEYARIAARHFGTAHHEYYVTPEDVARSLPDVARYYDQPFGNSSALPAYYCAKMAKDDGVDKILAGDGGDELFGGNTRYAKQRVFGVYGELPAALRAGMETVLDVPFIGRAPLLRKGKSYVDQARVPMPDRIQTYNLLERLGVGTVLTQAFLAQVDRSGPIAHQRAVWAEARATTLLDRQLAFDWRYTLAENDLPKVCGTTAMAGVGVGFPMLDRELVDFSLRLPTSYKLKGLRLRWFFKEALRGFLPDEIIVKKKHGFGLPFGAWAQSHSGLNAVVRESLGSLATRGIVRPVFVKALLDRYLGEHPGYYGEMVWILTVLENWLQGHAPRYRVST